MKINELHCIDDVNFKQIAMFSIQVSSVQLGSGLIFGISDVFIAWIKANCEVTKRRL